MMSVTSPKTFTILSYNICGINNDTRAAELTIYLTRHQPSILILQEPKHNHFTHYIKDGKQLPRTPKPLPSFRNYSHYQFKHPTQPTVCSATLGIYSRNPNSSGTTNIGLVSQSALADGNYPHW